MSKLKKIKEYLDKEFGEEGISKLRSIEKEIKKLNKGIGNKQISKDIKEITGHLDHKKELKTLAKAINNKEQLTAKDLSYIESAIQTLVKKEYPEPHKEVKVENLDEIKPKEEIKVNNLDDIKIPSKVKLEGKNPDDYPIKEEVIERDSEGRLVKTRVVYKDFTLIITDNYTIDGYWDGATYAIERT